MRSRTTLAVLTALLVLSSTARGTVVAGWGWNGNGQTAIPAGLSTATAVDAGTYFSVALKANGTVVAWGGGSYSTPPPGLSGVSAIAAGGSQCLALKSDGTVVGWGGSQNGLPAGLPGITAIAAGSFHSIALKSDGTVVCWGRQYEGQTSPPAGLSNVIAIAAGGYHSIALKSDGTVVAWGDNRYGQATPPTGLSDVIAVAAGYSHSLALKSDGTVVDWGDHPAAPAGLSGVTKIACGEYHSLAVKSDGTVVCWGYNSGGQCNPPARLSGVVSIAGGNEHSLAVANITNQPPVAEAGPNQTVEATVSGTYFRLDGSGSHDPDGDSLTYSWMDALGNYVGSGQTAWLSGSLGQYVYRLTVTDSFGWSSATDSVTVTIVDTQAPVISSIICTPPLASPGDVVSIQVSANDATNVAYVKLNGVNMTPGCLPLWTGTVTAAAGLGQHSFVLETSDGVNPAATTTGSYANARVFGVGAKNVRSALMAQASANWQFRLWGRVKNARTNYFDLDNGSGTLVTIYAPGYAGVSNGNSVSVRGVLNTKSLPATLTSRPGLITKY